MLCASTTCTQHVMQLFLLVHDQSNYKCLAQLPLLCQTIGLPLSAINSVSVMEILVQLEPMLCAFLSNCACPEIQLYPCIYFSSGNRLCSTKP